MRSGMKLLSFAEINDAENGQQISSFTGTIKKVWEQKSGEGDYGPWHLQNIILTDEHANEITVTWTLEDAWTAKDEGKQLLFESGYDKKEQLCGLKKDIRKKDGKTYESVKVDDRAKVKTLGDDDEANNRHSTEILNGGVDEARKHIMQSANLYVLCINAVNKYIAAHMPEIAQTSEMFQAATGTLFIEASRAGLVSKMPEKPL